MPYTFLGFAGSFREQHIQGTVEVLLEDGCQKLRWLLCDQNIWLIGKNRDVILLDLLIATGDCYV